MDDIVIVVLIPSNLVVDTLEDGNPRTSITFRTFPAESEGHGLELSSILAAQVPTISGGGAWWTTPGTLVL